MLLKNTQNIYNQEYTKKNTYLLTHNTLLRKKKKKIIGKISGHSQTFCHTHALYELFVTNYYK